MSESPAEPTPGAQAPPASAEQLLEELRKVKVGDMLVHTGSMLASLAYGKLAPETRDLADARLAIEQFLIARHALAQVPELGLQGQQRIFPFIIGPAAQLSPPGCQALAQCS